jgi:hypothetical protein
MLYLNLYHHHGNRILYIDDYWFYTMSTTAQKQMF